MWVRFPPSPHVIKSPIAQLVELLPLKQEVQGSSPCGGTGKLEAPFDSGVRGVRCQSKEHWQRTVQVGRCKVHTNFVPNKQYKVLHGSALTKPWQLRLIV